jgi:hypothetical protein
MLQWHYLPELPDDETTVLMAAKDGDVHEGYHEGDGWKLSNERPIFDVYAWAPIPEAPPPP